LTIKKRTNLSEGSAGIDHDLGAFSLSSRETVVEEAEAETKCKYEAS
jgi:hypothetical protein